jgi:uncharacterized damage-inducible protein DinB
MERAQLKKLRSHNRNFNTLIISSSKQPAWLFFVFLNKEDSVTFVMLIEKYINDFDEVFSKQPWYGEAVLPTLNTINHAIAGRKPERVENTIAIIVDHMIKWKRFAIEKLKGNMDFKIEINSGADWNHHLVVNNEDEWQGLINMLISAQQELVQQLTLKNDEWLFQKTFGKDYSNDYLIKGIMDHDVYHLGQIRLLKKMLENS